MAAENIRNLQPWTIQQRRASGWRLDFGFVGRVFGIVLLGAQRRQAIKRAHDLTDPVGGDAGVERRRFQFGMSKKHLNHTNIDILLKQVSRKGVSLMPSLGLCRALDLLPTPRSSKMTRCCRRVSEDLQVADHIDDAAEIEARVKQWWGDRLVPVPESALVGRRLSMRTHSFLTKVGVPRDAPGQVTFYTGDEPLRPLAVAGETYWVVGDDYGTEITLSIRGDVWSIDPEGQLPRRFINASIAHFVLFLGLYEAEYEGVGDTDNREPVAIEGELRTQFDEYDLFALANAENWWSLVLEQIGQGLL